MLAPPRAPTKKSTPIFRIIARAIPNCGAATSRCTRTYCFDGDIRHIIIDVSLVRRRVATRRRSCRPQRVDFQQNSLMRGRNALASTASPNNPITTLLARRHLLRNCQHPQRAHCHGGGLCCPTREVITILIICFIYYFLFFANPLPSSIPPPLDLHNRQVDDYCVADNKEILIEGGQVDVLAEKEEEDVGLDLLVGMVCKSCR